ncbi:hypothetical protein ACB092_11G087600 [Castanea dentata]
MRCKIPYKAKACLTSLTLSIYYITLLCFSPLIASISPPVDSSRGQQPQNINDGEEEDANFKHFPSRDEWNRFERMTRFLKPFNEITTLFSRIDYATIDYIFMECLKLN